MMTTIIEIDHLMCKIDDLDQNGIQSVWVGASLCVLPTEACGALLEFVPEN
jgi:hypothetical protein